MESTSNGPEQLTPHDPVTNGQDKITPKQKPNGNNEKIDTPCNLNTNDSDNHVTDADGAGGDAPASDYLRTDNNQITITRPKNLINGDDVITIIQPNSLLPKPEKPPGLLVDHDHHPSSSPPPPPPPPQPRNGENNGGATMNLRSQSLTDSFDMPAIGKYIRDRSNRFSDAIVRRLSSLKDDHRDYGYEPQNGSKSLQRRDVTELDLSGLKVIVKLKPNEQINTEAIKGRITFFSRSNSRDCKAVRSFFREKGLHYVEINVDVFPLREKELIERTGSNQVPQIFFNEKLFGGLVALNSLRNSGDFDKRLKELLGRKYSGGAPEIPVYGFDDPEEELVDDMVGIVRVLRQRLPIQDRLMKMKIVKNCFAGSELVEVVIHHLDCGRKKATEIGKQLVRKHFIHNVFWENDFEDGNHFYRFLEHEPFIPRCFNFCGSTNDKEPKSAAVIGIKLMKLMSAILESYSSDDRCHVNYAAISSSEEFRRYVNLTRELHRVDLLELSPGERLAFFLNLHNAMVIHAIIRVGLPESIVDRRSFYSDFQYVVGGYSYSLSMIRNGILRGNRRPPYTLTKPFSNGDKRIELVVPKLNPLIHFGLCDGTRSSPTVRFFSPQGVEAELRCAAREFFQNDGMEVDLAKRTVRLNRLIQWYSVDFGQDKEILRWIPTYLDATKAGLLTHLLSDGGPINIAYKKYDWSVNC